MKDKDFQSYSLEQWLEHIQRQHWRTIDLTLDRVASVWERLGQPRPQTNIIVAGTNGKGSSIAMLHAILLNAGRRSGAYTSPHLVRFNERIRTVEGEVTDGEICQAFREIETARGEVPLTYFEYGTLCALLVFATKGVDVGLLEVGMGGRADAVNIVPGDLVLITSIGLDHQQWLGHDRESIAGEKAGIIKHGKPVVYSGRDIPDSLCSEAAKRGAPLLILGRDYGFDETGETFSWFQEDMPVPTEWQVIKGVSCPYPGHHQQDNLAGVIASLALTRDLVNVSPGDLVPGLAGTRLEGRCQVIPGNPEIILDVSHNADSARVLAGFLENRDCAGRTVGVTGALADKSVDQIYAPLSGIVDQWFLVSISGERGQSSEGLARKMEGLLESGDFTLCESPVSGFENAMQSAEPEDRIVIFGSFYLVGDIIAAIDNMEPAHNS